MGRKYSVTVTGPDGQEIPISLELHGPPDAGGFVWLDKGTKIHEGDFRAAVEAFVQGTPVRIVGSEAVVNRARPIIRKGYSIGGKVKK